MPTDLRRPWHRVSWLELGVAIVGVTAAVLAAGACATASVAVGPPGGADGGRDESVVVPADAAADAPAVAPVDAATDGSAVPVVPPPPSDVRDRLGVYAWGFDTTSWPGTPDQLNWAAGRVAALGARTIRVYLGPQDVYHVLPDRDGGAFSLADAAASPAYHTLFASPSFDTILLTTYTASDDQSDWADGYTAEEVAAERQEIAQLGGYLLQTYPGKTFILLNWEGDNALASVAGNQAAWDGFIAWTNARAAGVEDARALAAGAAAHLYSGVEFNLLRSLATQAPCDTSVNKCVVSAVLPSVSVDYYSYSSWDSLLPDQTPAAVATELQTDLTTALGWAQRHDPSVTPARFIVGEFGAPREQADLGECAATARIAAVLEAIPAWGASYGVFWQIIDNVPSAQPNTFMTGFGLYKASGSPSLAAQLFQTLYQTQSPTPPIAPSCPLINQGGVVNHDYPSETAIASTTVLSVYGAGFTASGNVVHVRETGQAWDITAGSPVWFESPPQINFTLPGVGPGQEALVFATDGDGVDSNGQIISIEP
jgi:hypothetical protein